MFTNHAPHTPPQGKPQPFAAPKESASSPCAADADIVRAIEAGDPWAEHQLALRCEEVLGRVLHKITPDPELRRDLQQEAFITVLVRLREGKLRQAASLPGYIYRTALFLSYEEIRKYRARQVPVESSAYDRLAQCDDDPTAAIEAAQRRKLLARAIGELNVERDRELLRRTYIYGQDKPTVAAFLDLSAQHFDRVHSRSKSRLRRRLEVIAAL